MKKYFELIPLHLLIKMWGNENFHLKNGGYISTSSLINGSMHWVHTNEGQSFWEKYYYKYDKNNYRSNLKYFL